MVTGKVRLPSIQHTVSGMRRDGHDSTYSLCDWHHFGYPLENWESLPGKDGGANQASSGLLGPSLMHGRRTYEQFFGPEALLVAIATRLVKSFEESEDARLMDENFQAAFRMMTSEQARSAFDLSKEPQKVRERYGMNRFGQCCLLARRLVENGVRFITINTFLTVFNDLSWDIHGSKPFSSIEGMKNEIAPMYDQGYSALLEDLHQRGMLDNTLVTGLCEFGRTPRVNPAGGRDHQE